MRAPRHFLDARAPDRRLRHHHQRHDERGGNMRETRARLIGRWIAIGLCALSLVVALPFPAERVAAAGYTVTTTSGSGPGSLLDAIRQVNAGAGTGDTITITATGTITPDIGLPEILNPVAITGPGAALLTVSGGNAMQVFVVHTGVTVSISTLTIASGKGGSSAGQEGGGIRNSGTLTVTNTILSNNNVVSDGGGIFNAGTLTLTNSTLSGNSANGSLSDGGGIYNKNGGTVTVMNSTLSGNTASSLGDGIYNNGGTLTLTNSTLSSNTASGHGGIYNNGGMVTVTNSTLSGNNALFTGGGICNDHNGTLTVTNSTFSGNSVTTGGNGGDGGGGISNNGMLTVTNSTFSGNSANGALADGGGIDNFGMLTVTNSTFSGNSATSRGGGIFNFVGTVNLTNTIVAGNTATGTGPDIGLAVVSNGHNLIGNTSGSSGFVASDLQNVPPALGPLASNGGPTQTLALLPISPAIDRGDDTICANTAGVAPVAGKDQRGITRPQGAHCDIGAFEYNGAAPPPPTAITVTATAATIPVSGTDQFTATCTYTTGPASTCTTSVTWSSDTPAVATITPAGLATGVSAGAAKITASLSGITSNAVTLTVTGGGPPPAGGLQFYPLAKPVRLLDTRSGSTAFVAPNTALTAGQTLSLPGQFSYQGVTIPATAQAIVGNATVANGSNGTPPGFATIFPSGVPLPLTSNLNFVPGTVRPNAFTVALGSDTKFNLYSSSGGDFVVDISGYYAPVGAGGLYFHPLSAPVRELDTRAGATAFVHPNAALTAGQTLTLPGSFTYNSITVPASAKALVGNATVANGSNGTPAGFATLFPDDVPLPLASNLNFVPGTVAPNAFTVALGGGGGYKLYSSSGGDFVVDITGYLDTTAAGGLLFTPLSAPVRELDTRVRASAFVAPGATLTAGQTLTLSGSFTFAGITVPAGAKALVGNATVANDGNNTPAGFATLYPDGVPLPLASNLNFVPKQVAPNAITVGIGADGKYALYTSSGGDFIVDITGYFSDATAPNGARKP